MNLTTPRILKASQPNLLLFVVRYAFDQFMEIKPMSLPQTRY